MEFHPFKHYGTFWRFAQNMMIRIKVQEQFTEKAKKVADDCKDGDSLTWSDALRRFYDEEMLLKALYDVWKEFLNALKDTEREALLKDLNELFAARSVL